MMNPIEILNKKKLFHWHRLKLLLVIIIVGALPSMAMAQELTQDAVSNGAGLVSGGNYTGYASAGQMGTYMYANGTVIATSGIILNEMSGTVEFTFELSGNLTDNPNLNSAAINLKSSVELLVGAPLSFANVYLILVETGEVFASTQTDANGFFKFENVPYKDFYFTVDSPVPPADPVVLTFESNIFIKEVEINGEVGTEGISAAVAVTPTTTCDPENPDYQLWYLDSDNDGYGNPNYSVGQCSQPVGYVANDMDCDDSDDQINPENLNEIVASGIDANCDGQFLWYEDLDGDGFGSEQVVSSASPVPGAGTSDNSLDCNDSNPNVNPDIANDVPGSREDTNCDGLYTWYQDNDGDGFGSDILSSSENTSPGNGESDNNQDCDDTNAEINPDAVEPPGTLIDLNCDGIIPCSEIEIVDFNANNGPFTTDDLVEFSASVNNAAGASATWDWGNGETTEGIFSQDEILGNYIYPEAGIYTVTLSVQNICGFSDEITFEHVIVSEFCEGRSKFTIMGIGKPTFTMKTRFGRTIKRSSILRLNIDVLKQAGRSEIEMNLLYKMKGRNTLIFSDNPEWVVVKEPYIYVKGEGKINKNENATFLLVLHKVQARLYQFRIIIWDSFGDVYYNNQPDSGPFDTPTNTLVSYFEVFRNSCNSNTDDDFDDDDDDMDEKSVTIANFETEFNSTDFSMKAFPNPTFGRVTLEVDSDYYTAKNIVVRNIAGQKILEKSFQSGNEFDLDLSGNSPGVYFITLSSESESLTQKLLLQSR